MDSFYFLPSTQSLLIDPSTIYRFPHYGNHDLNYYAIHYMATYNIVPRKFKLNEMSKSCIVVIVDLCACNKLKIP